MLSALAQIWNEHIWFVRSAESWTWLIPFSIRRVKLFASSVAGRRLTTGQYHRLGKILNFSCAPGGKFIKKVCRQPILFSKEPTRLSPHIKISSCLLEYLARFFSSFFENLSALFSREDNERWEICIRPYSRRFSRCCLEPAELMWLLQTVLSRCFLVPRRDGAGCSEAMQPQ